MALDTKTRTELEAAAFRRLLEHLRTRTDVQNIDLMNLAGFCRNCLSNWHAIRGMEGEVPERRVARAEGGIRKGRSEALTLTRRCALLWMT